ncbi:MAG: ABC transporter ATP-binding protein, partial [Candidatus Korarchaeota archaeon]|nr:ABC transporter ATP-binding protein [Candidatus Korarchaeota archaeon]NIU85240.1 ATP-binding cassette domain-containing protein [Candidatus Thorarchaeota archaeon]NIW15323.1 ATP-binding cassette domain-containing protein [Candidatus Thorarchaeota archaeon]NIW53288.1 ATP-binding cassette domain-containing protein [Candidatus Korarchaeota archaeon]
KKYYNRGNVKAVDGISFEVPIGSRFGFLGPNGAGKTTTIRCLLGFLNPDGGTIKILGEQVNPKKAVKIRNQIGYLPEELGLYRNMTASQLVTYFSRLYDVEIDWDFVQEIVERLKISMDRKMGELSSGNKQKVGVLTALMGKFKLLIMDEPTSGLDPLMQSEFYRIVAEWQRRSNCTVFLSSHVLPEVEKFCDRVAIIRKGKIAKISSVQELKEKSLKHIELVFETAKGMHEFKSFLTAEFPRASIQHHFDREIIFLLPPAQTRSLMKELSEQTWAGKPVKDMVIKHSSLENIFMQYYENSNQEEGISSEVA